MLEPDEDLSVAFSVRRPFGMAHVFLLGMLCGTVALEVVRCLSA